MDRMHEHVCKQTNCVHEHVNKHVDQPMSETLGENITYDLPGPAHAYEYICNGYSRTGRNLSTYCTLSARRTDRDEFFVFP